MAAAAESSSFSLSSGSLYDVVAVGIEGLSVPLSLYRGKNYRQLAELYGKYGPQGLEVLAFPCNQFGNQEPGTNKEVEAFARARGASYPLFAKSTVNGACTVEGPGQCAPDSTLCCPVNDAVYKYLKGVLPGDITWNFEKFLVNASGVPVKRYEPHVAPLAIVPDIEALLKESTVIKAKRNDTDEMDPYAEDM
eukprot:jgi/Chlat1/6516/Chrsp45S05997